MKRVALAVVKTPEPGVVPLWPVVLVRIGMGVLWLGSLRWKLPPDFESSTEKTLREWLELEVAHPAVSVYGEVIDRLVLPNYTLFAWIIFLAELTVGILLLVGLFTRLGALLGLLMSLNLAVGLLAVPGEWPWSYLMMIMLHGLLLVSPAGELWGLDGLRSTKILPTKKGATT